jgi:hypothetical protein
MEQAAIVGNVTRAAHAIALSEMAPRRRIDDHFGEPSSFAISPAGPTPIAGDAARACVIVRGETRFPRGPLSGRSPSRTKTLREATLGPDL